MKRLMIIAVLLTILVPLGLWQITSSASASGKIPTFSILSVERDQTVTIKTSNFPANYSFDVLMGAMGTRGINGIKVDTIKSGEGGSFQKTFDIPASLKESYQIAIRLQSNTGSGYYAYNWFYNNTTGNGTKPTVTPNGYTGFPTFKIQSVVRDKTVTIKTSNLPPNDSFNVLMAVRGNQAINGIKVDTVNSGTGGMKTFTFDIPASLKGTPQIAIRLQSNTGSGYFAYNWFYNNTTAATSTPGPTATPGPTPTPRPVYSGFPTFSISSVVRDKTVTIKTKNLPPNDSFNVLMAVRGNQAINGIKVDTVNSGAGGTRNFTFDIPASLKSTPQIAIRLQSNTGSGYFAYNWFYNNTATVDP